MKSDITHKGGESKKYLVKVKEPEYIAKEDILKHKCNVYDEEHHLLYAVPTGSIIAMESAKVAPIRTAMWVRKEDDETYWYECSECGERPAKTQYGNDYFSAYCPHCGIKIGCS